MHLIQFYPVDWCFAAQFDVVDALLPHTNHLKDSPRAKVRHCHGSRAWMETHVAAAKSSLASSASTAMLPRNCCCTNVSDAYLRCLVSRKTLSGSS